MKYWVCLLVLILTSSTSLYANNEPPEVEKEIKSLKEKRSQLQAEIRQLESRIESLEKQMVEGGNKPSITRARPQLM